MIRMIIPVINEHQAWFKPGPAMVIQLLNEIPPPPHFNFPTIVIKINKTPPCPGVIRELKQPQRQRQGKHRFKSDFQIFHTSSR